MPWFGLLLFFLIIPGWGLESQVLDEHLPSGPFPVPGPIYNRSGQTVGTAKVYPRFVEIYDQENRFLGKVGILVEHGYARIHMVNQNKQLSMVGYAHKGRIFNSQDKVIGTYFWTPTYSFVHDLNGKRVGSTKCIAWPRVCSVGVAGYLLGLLNGKEPVANEKNP